MTRVSKRRPPDELNIFTQGDSFSRFLSTRQVAATLSDVPLTLARHGSTLMSRCWRRPPATVTGFGTTSSAKSDRPLQAMAGRCKPPFCNVATSHDRHIVPRAHPLLGPSNGRADGAVPGTGAARVKAAATLTRRPRGRRRRDDAWSVSSGVQPTSVGDRHDRTRASVRGGPRRPGARHRRDAGCALRDARPARRGACRRGGHGVRHRHAWEMHCEMHLGTRLPAPRASTRS